MKRFPTKLIIATIVLAGSLFTARAQNSQDRDVSGFDAINVEGSFEVIIEEGARESLRMEGNSETMNKIMTEVSDGTLKIFTDRKWWDFDGWNNGGSVTIYITYKALNSLSMSGSGKIEAEDELRANSFGLYVSGSGNIQAPINVSSLESAISGSGKIAVSGRTEDAEVRISGSGDFMGEKLSARNASIHISGSGNARITAEEELDAHISGSGNVYYGGNPTHKSISSSGSGKAIAGK